VRRPGTDPERPFVMAVNVDLEESDLARIDPTELALQIEMPTASPNEGPRLGEAVALRREDQERRQALWRWLLAVALSLFAVETVLSNWVSRRSSGALGGARG
jgi:hypothetical protein